MDIYPTEPQQELFDLDFEASILGLLCYCFGFFGFCLFRAVPAAYGDSQARSLMGATAASLHHSHSNTRSKPCLRPTPQVTAMLSPLSEARDGTCILMDPGWIRFRCTMTETP